MTRSKGPLEERKTCVQDENALGQFVDGLRQEVAVLEAALRKDAIHEGFVRRALEGWCPHRPIFPYVTGNSDEGEAPVRLDPSRPERAALARRFFELVATGLHTVDQARRALVEEGHVYSSSRTVIPRPVANRLLRERFAHGEFTFRGKVYMGKHEPIITKDLWLRVQVVLDNRSAK